LSDFILPVPEAELVLPLWVIPYSWYSLVGGIISDISVTLTVTVITSPVLGFIFVLVSVSPVSTMLPPTRKFLI